MKWCQIRWGATCECEAYYSTFCSVVYAYGYINCILYYFNRLPSKYPEINNDPEYSRVFASQHSTPYKIDTKYQTKSEVATKIEVAHSTP